MSMPLSVKERVRKRREVLRAAGLRPVQLWVPDTRRPDFDQECLRQSLVVAQADLADPDLMDFLDQALGDAEEGMA